MARPIGTVASEARRRREAMRCHVVRSLGRAVSVDHRHVWKVPEPITTEIWSEGFAGGNQRSESAQRTKGGLVGRPLEDFAQQRRHDL